ncbi:MAG: glutamine-hydrolyzing GMP synthase [Bacteroidetes bacterium]|nr:glutamine-hydrolyzing GMP synthase [Bacteroidota bacterium]
MHQSIIIFDFGSQYTQLIARRIRELNIYCEIHPFTQIEKYIQSQNKTVKGYILSGSPFSVRDEASPKPDWEKLAEKAPVLGICYGAQLIAQTSGGEVLPSKIREYGRANLSKVNSSTALFKDITENTQVWMSHGDTISKAPSNAVVTASTSDIPVAGFELTDKKVFGIQFHPEVFHSTQGSTILKNFAVSVCKCDQSWTAFSFIEETITKLKLKLSDDPVIMALSGGVDSTVAAVLLQRTIGKNLYCIFVNNGLLRKNEYAEVLKAYEKMGLNIKGVDASEKFYSELKDVSDPETKRKIIGRLFIEVFDEEAKSLNSKLENKIKWLGQGTIYPDVIESVSVKGPSATIKSHHNVGGLPAKMNLQVVEPLSALFKDEVRAVGKELGISDTILGRHPFPGPGLAIRILGDITEEKVRLTQEADAIFIENLKESGLYKSVWQAGCILLPVKSVGVMGDERTYENVVALRAVTSTDGMTADWCHLPYDFLAKVSNEIINKTKGINRVVYDISSKPPATIEWE